MNHDFEAQFRARVDACVTELDALVRRSVLQAVESVLGGHAATRSTGHAVNGSTAGGAASNGVGNATRPRRRKRVDVLARDAEAIAGPLLALLAAHGGLRIEEITSRTRMPAARLAPLIERLLADGRLRVEEHRFGARYVAAAAVR